MIYITTPPWSAKCIFPSLANLHIFFLNLLLPRPLWPPFLSLTFKLKMLCPSQNMTIFTPQHIYTYILPYQLALFAIVNWSMVSFIPNINIKSIDHFLSMSCTPHIALNMDLSVLCKIPISPLRHHVSLSYSIAGHT